MTILQTTLLTAVMKLWVISMGRRPPSVSLLIRSHKIPASWNEFHKDSCNYNVVKFIDPVVQEFTKL